MRRHFALYLLALSFVPVAVASNPRPKEYPTFATIDVPGATSTAALDINTAGEIVGSYTDAQGTHGYLRGREGKFTSIDFPAAVFTRLAGINGRGDIVGTYRLPTDPMAVRHGFLLSAGKFTTIDPPGAVFTNPLGINQWRGQGVPHLPMRVVGGGFSEPNDVDRAHTLNRRSTR